jgi:filamentous hemagglutinin
LILTGGASSTQFAGALTQLATSQGTADAVAGWRLGLQLAAAQANDPQIGTTIPGASAPVKVTAEASVGGQTFFDVNQTARPMTAEEASRPTLIADLLRPGVPNGTYGGAHAEIGTIQQAYDAGLTQGQSMTIVVRGQPPCSFCNSDLKVMADRSGLNSLTVVDGSTGAVLQWTRVSGDWATIKEEQITRGK